MYIAIGIAAALFAADRILKYLSRMGKLKWERRYVRLTHLENRGFFLGLGQKHEKLLRWLPLGVWLAAAACLLPELGKRAFAAQLGILSVLLQAWYDIEYLFTVDENVFNPPPKVKSGVIKLVRNNVTDLGCDERLFKTVVKTSFGMRRKMLRSSLKSMFPQGSPVLATDLFRMRPEQLSVQQFVDLTNMVAAERNNDEQTK